MYSHMDTDEPDNGSKKKRSKEWLVSNAPLREDNVSWQCQRVIAGDKHEQ